jgi:hypothetical protein
VVLKGITRTTNFVIKQEILGRINRLLSFHMTRTGQEMACPTILLLWAAVTFLPSICLANIGEYKIRRTVGGGGFIKYAFGMGSGATIYAPIFIKLGSGIQEFMEGDTHTHNTDSMALS